MMGFLISFNHNIDYQLCNYNNLIINNSDLKDEIKIIYIYKKNHQYVKVLKLNDQGEIFIECLNIYQHTINNIKIKTISREINYKQKKFLLFKKNCIKENIPNNDTLIDPNEKLIYKNKIIEAKIFLIKYSKDVEIVDCEKINLFNILFENDINININNLIIKSFNYQYKKKNHLIEKEYYEKKWNNLTKIELLNHYNQFGRYENKIMNYKLNIDNADFNNFKLKYSKYKNLSNEEIWNHWIKYGQYKNEILMNKYADLDEYKKYKRFKKLFKPTTMDFYGKKK